MIQLGTNIYWYDNNNKFGNSTGALYPAKMDLTKTGLKLI